MAAPADSTTSCPKRVQITTNVPADSGITLRNSMEL
jgi:hypothetical protein